MSAPNPRYPAAERPQRLQEALNTIGSWILATVEVEPGWNELVLDIKPLSDTVFVRITESRDEDDYVGSVGPVKEGSPLLEAIEMLQHAAFTEDEGTWFTASVVVTASGWPEPTYQLGASYDRANEPDNWKGEGRLSARDIRQHLDTFPRTEANTPDWALTRLAGRRDQGPADLNDQGDINRYLTEALSLFASNRTEQALANVVRAIQGGELIMDISQSAPGSDGNLQLHYQVLRLSNGMRALTAYSNPTHAQALAQLDPSNTSAPRLQAEPAMKVLYQVLNDPSIDLLLLDPRTPQECFIEKAQIQWVIGTPHNEPAKTALVAGSMQGLLTALTAPAAMLLLGVRPGDSAGRPIVLRQEETSDTSTALVFTSAAEIAALDPTLEVRSAPALEVLRLITAGEATHIRINALAPHATLPISQVKELLALTDNN